MRHVEICRWAVHAAVARFQEAVSKHPPHTPGGLCPVLHSNHPRLCQLVWRAAGAHAGLMLDLCILLSKPDSTIAFPSSD
jgi:hypothetical protein